MMTAVDTPAPPPAPMRAIQGYAGPRRTVLVVDDDGNQRALMRDLLAPLGFVVLEATDAASCRSLIEAVSPDLFLLDVSMPGRTAGRSPAHSASAGRRGRSSCSRPT